MKVFPKATRQLEYVAFFIIEMPTKEGMGYAYFACDGFSEYAFNTGVESNKNPETILKHIYLLTEHPEFSKKMKKGFTLVIGDFQELADRIEGIIKLVNGKVLFDKSFNNFLSKPVRETFAEFK